MTRSLNQGHLKEKGIPIYWLHTRYGWKRSKDFLTLLPLIIITVLAHFYMANTCTCNKCAWKDTCADLAFELFCWEKLVVQVRASRPQNPAGFWRGRELGFLSGVSSQWFVRKLEFTNSVELWTQQNETYVRHSDNKRKSLLRRSHAVLPSHIQN